jgi:hypothetical protein
MVHSEYGGAIELLKRTTYPSGTRRLLTRGILDQRINSLIEIDTAVERQLPFSSDKEGTSR